MSLVLTDSGEKLEITAGVVIPFTVHYADYVGATPVFTPGVAAGDTINGTKDLLVAPGSGQRVVRTISVHNDSGGVDTITVQLDDGGTNYVIVTVILPDDYTLCYDEDGWCVLDTSGAAGTTLFAHAILGPHHSDAATDVVSQGSLMYGNATPAWDELVHPGAVNRVLQSSAAEVVWSANAVTFPTAGAVPIGSGANTQIAYWTAANTLAGDAGLTYNAATDSLTIAGDILMADDHFIGITGDIRIEFDQTDGHIMLHLGDEAGVDEVQVVDSGSGVVAYIDSDGNADFANHIAIATDAAVSAARTVNIEENAISHAGGARYGLYTSFGKTLGASDINSHFYGQWGRVTFNQAATTMGDMYGYYMEVNLNNGNIGDIANPRGVIGYRASVNLNAGRVFSSIYGMNFVVDQAAGNTVDKNLIGIHIFMDSDGTVTLNSYMLYLNEASGVDYCIYQYSAGTPAPSYLGGRVAIGGTVAAVAQLHVDQGSATGAIPVLYLDQGDPDEDMIEFACTIGVGNAIEAVGGKTLTTTHFIKVTLPGALTRYIPVGTIA